MKCESGKGKRDARPQTELSFWVFVGGGGVGMAEFRVVTMRCKYVPMMNSLIQFNPSYAPNSHTLGKATSQNFQHL